MSLTSGPANDRLSTGEVIVEQFRANVVPNEETPRDARFTTILLVGRMSTGGRDDLCRVRNISPGGMRIETRAPVNIGQQIAVELRNGIIVQSEVIWVDQAQAGVRFDEPVDIAQMLALKERSGKGGTPPVRSPRLSSRCPVAMRHDGRIVPGVMINVSQSGAHLFCSGKLGRDDQVVIFIPGLGSHRATVRWVRDDAVGIGFTERLGFGDLAEWLSSPDRFTPEPSFQTAPDFSLTRQNS